MELKTYTGKFVNVFDLKESDISLIDIAHSLSNICRFCGHVSQFLSVAEHSVRVSRACSEENKLKGLLHDASEAYLMDIPRPLKHLPEFKFYRLLEEEIQNKIFVAFGLSEGIPKEVHEWDNILLEIEQCSFMGKQDTSLMKEKPISLLTRTWSPAEAKAKFLNTYLQITTSKELQDEPKI